MSLRIIRRVDQRVVPWKNGRGSTLEIAIDPPEATVASSFDWRISAARIEEDGPFSAFPGIDRTLILLEGRDLVLEMPDERVSLTRPFAEVSFAGEVPVTARLGAGPVRDLNVMVRRDAYDYEVDVILPPRQRVVGPADTAIAVVLAGTVTIGGQELSVGDAAIGQSSIAVEGTATVLAVRLRRR